VNPPGIQDWETTAAAWLLDLVPEYRQHAAVRVSPPEESGSAVRPVQVVHVSYLLQNAQA
jgi:hypothetical protein